MSEVWSNGGGTQSAAIAALIVRGDLPKPDAAVIADTNLESSATWRYMDEVIQPALNTVGVELVLVQGLATVGVYSNKEGKPLMPVFTEIDGKRGQTSKWCSNEWKSRPIDRWLKQNGFDGGNLWIGFSTDEIQRMRGPNSRVKWQHVYPLADLRMSRSDCIALVERMGWPPPPRSSCWCCPYRTDHEWKHQRDTEPKDHDKAVALDNHIRRTTGDALYLHRLCKPLTEIDFGDDESQLELGCDSGMCFT